MFRDATVDHEIETYSQRPYKGAPPESSGIWPWAATALLSLLMAAGGYMLHGDTYASDKPALTEKLSTMQTSVTQLQDQNRETQRKLNRICIALGVDPDGVLEVRSRKATTSHD